MAFGTWMKKIKEGVQNFGNKIKNWANKNRDKIEKGLDTVGNIARTGLDIVGTVVGGDTGQKIRETGDNIKRWTGGASERFLKPAYTMMNGPDSS